MSIRTRCACVLASAISLTTASLAAEVVVQNDNIPPSGAITIVGDFVAGEEGGVVLKSPCDGNIVGIQILWLSGTPGAPQTLEEAIHIYTYQASTFPFPGPEKQLMEGPLLTPGFWNEFRYIDDAQTIPLNVRVNRDEKFIVTLQFYNPTNVLGGSASLCRDADGCTTNSNVLFAVGWGWSNFCGFPVFLQGDLGIRAVIDCIEPGGTCCYADGVCVSDATQADCTAAYGAVWHGQVPCGSITCVPRGACCRQGGCLDLLSQTDCLAIGGVWAGAETKCSDGVCTKGACCNTGTCTLMFEFECLASGGAYQGAGTTCTPNPCPQPQGACCITQTFCFPQLEAACIGAGGTWAGANTTCADNNSNGKPDVCEAPSVCAGDTNCDGAVTFADIDMFVARLGCPSGNPTACAAGCDWHTADINGDGAVTFADIDPFVSRLGAVCP